MLSTTKAYIQVIGSEKSHTAAPVLISEADKVWPALPLLGDRGTLYAARGSLFVYDENGDCVNNTPGFYSMLIPVEEKWQNYFFDMLTRAEA